MVTWLINAGINDTSIRHKHGYFTEDLNGYTLSYILYNWSLILYFRVIPYLTKIVIRSFTNWYLLGSISVYGYQCRPLEQYWIQHAWINTYNLFNLYPQFPRQFSILLSTICCPLIYTFHIILPPNLHFPNPDTPPPHQDSMSRPPALEANGTSIEPHRQLKEYHLKINP